MYVGNIAEKKSDEFIEMNIFYFYRNLIYSGTINILFFNGFILAGHGKKEKKR